MPRNSIRETVRLDTLEARAKELARQIKLAEDTRTSQRVSPVDQQTQVSSLTFERGESRLSDDDEHHEMGGHNYLASGGVVPRGEQPDIGSYRRFCLGRPAGQASNPCRKVFLGCGFRSDSCAFQPDRTDCPLWKQHTMAERVGPCDILDGCSRTEVRT